MTWHLKGDMSLPVLVAYVAVGLASLPALLAVGNLIVFRRPRQGRAPGEKTPLSVLVPARNEEGSIEACVRSVLATEGVDFECVVLDDASEDDTAEIVTRLAAEDRRVRLVRGSGPPPGWNGKQYACFKLAEAAEHDLFCWIDADVRVTPDCFARLVGERGRRGLDLLSGLPRQITGTWMEHLLIPLIHVVLLGYLPLPAARLSKRTAFAAGCGQCFLTTRAAYETSGTHEVIKNSRHDGVTLPRAYRSRGLSTDIVDLTSLASCRMYRSAAEVWAGLGKNATEGLATPVGVWVWTLLLAGGFLLPWAVLPLGEPLDVAHDDATKLAIVAIATGYLFRTVIAVRFKQSAISVLLGPVGIAALLALQWQAWRRDRVGKPVGWKGRPAVGAGEAV